MSDRSRAENEELRLRLEEAEQALEAIRTGQVDSLVVDGPGGVRIFSLESAIHSYRVLIEAMSEGAATVSEEGTILYCNGRLAEMLGAPLERVMGTALREWLPERLRPTLDSMMREAADADVRQELSLAAHGAEEIPVYVSLSEIHEDGGRVLCAVVTDLRDQKRNEEIVAAERLARSVLEQSAEAIVVCDREGRITRTSRAADALCGCNPLLLPFRQCFPLTALSAEGAPRDVAELALAGEVLRAAPSSLRREDGARFELLVTAAALRGDRGAIVGCVIALVDVTELRRREDALRESEERYRLAAESLREADRRKNEFLAVLSHELRNPLAPIHNTLYILERADPCGDQARRAQAVLRRQVGQLTRLVDDLLDLTRISRNKIELKPERLELNDLVRRTVEDHRSLFESNGIHLELRPAPEPIRITADGPRISQVVANLLQNSAKFTGRGGATRVTIARDDARRSAVVTILDTGVGISPDLVAHVFEPFKQGEVSIDRSKGGLGLGLSLVKSLVELHGGEVSARSAGVGQGAEFCVFLPLDEAPAAQAPGRIRPARRPRRVLVIEDSADSADSLREALQLAGHEVAVAYDGREGIVKARAFRPEVVLCDVGLPGMDGYAVARALREDKSLRGVYLVALSGYALPDDVERSAQAGFDRHIAKPASLETVDELLSSVPAAAQPAEQPGPLRP